MLAGWASMIPSLILVDYIIPLMMITHVFTGSNFYFLFCCPFIWTFGFNWAGKKLVFWKRFFKFLKLVFFRF